MVRPVVRSIRIGRPALAILPDGYRLGLLGVVLFTTGGMLDAAWHTLYGFERGIEVAASPPHVLLITGMVLIVSTPFRAAWAATNPTNDAPTLREFLPALVSLSLAITVVALIFYTLWGLGSSHYLDPRAGAWIAQVLLLSPTAIPIVHEMLVQRALSNILITNLLLLAPVLIILRRWQPPLGTVTILFTLSTFVMASIMPYFPALLPVPLLTGLVADWLIRSLAPTPARVGALRLFAVVVPVVLWSLYMVAVTITWGPIWPVSMWVGTLSWAGVSGLGLSLVAVPSSTESCRA